MKTRWLRQHLQTHKGRSGKLIMQFLKTRKKIKWNLLHKIFQKILETKADGNICMKHRIDFEMCSICLFWVQSEVPKAPSPLTLCKVKSHPLWPKESLREIQDITHTEGSNQANSNFLQDYFTVTVWRLYSYCLISWKTSEGLGSHGEVLSLVIKCPSQPPVNSGMNPWTSLLLCRIKGDQCRGKTRLTRQ